MSSYAERDFYLQEFRGRTLVLAGDRSTLRGIAARRRLAAVVKDLVRNGSRVLLVVGEMPADGARERREIRTWLSLPRVAMTRRRGRGRKGAREDVVVWSPSAPQAGPSRSGRFCAVGRSASCSTRVRRSRAPLGSPRRSACTSS
jgi:hypothetical protein